MHRTLTLLLGLAVCAAAISVSQVVANESTPALSAASQGSPVTLTHVTQQGGVIETVTTVPPGRRFVLTDVRASGPVQVVWQGRQNDQFLSLEVAIVRANGQLVPFGASSNPSQIEAHLTAETGVVLEPGDQLQVRTSGAGSAAGNIVVFSGYVL